jgi:hypothetical protein
MSAVRSDVLEEVRFPERIRRVLIVAAVGEEYGNSEDAEERVEYFRLRDLIPGRTENVKSKVGASLDVFVMLSCDVFVWRRDIVQGGGCLVGKSGLDAESRARNDAAAMVKLKYPTSGGDFLSFEGLTQL